MFENTKLNTNPPISSQDSAGVYYNEALSICSWQVDKQTCRIQTSCLETAKRISRWSFAVAFAKCICTSTRIFTIPKKKWKQALKALCIQGPVKNPKRVMHGIKLGRQNQNKGAVGHSLKKLKVIRKEISKESMGRAAS